MMQLIQTWDQLYDVATDSFELLEVEIIVDAIMTGATTYAPGEYLSVFFDATYADGTPVTTGDVTDLVNRT